MRRALTFTDSNPKKGIINTAVAIPKGVMKIVVSIHEGFVNLPALYGSEVRDTGEITGFQSGVKKAGKVCCVFRATATVISYARRTSSMVTTTASRG